MAMVAVLFDLSRVLEGLAAHRCPPQTNQLAGWFFCALILVFCLLFPPLCSQCSCEFKALKALFRTTSSPATNNLTVGIWVSGTVGMRVRGNVGRNSRLRMLRLQFCTWGSQMGKREQGTVPTNPHGQRIYKRRLSWVITQVASYPCGYVGKMFRESKRPALGNSRLRRITASLILTGEMPWVCG